MMQGRSSGVVFVWIQIATKTRKLGLTIQIGRAVDMVMPYSCSVTTHCADVSSFHPECLCSVLCVPADVDGFTSANTIKGIHCRHFLW
jgi:hypothetical protein